MTSLHFTEALTANGWQRDVRIDIAGRRIAAVTPGAAAAGCERHAIGLPGLASLHSHAFQRGMAGLAEHGSGRADSFWTWREAMYRFALALEPEQVAAIAAQLYVEMLEAGFTAVGEFHYLHHDRLGRPYAEPAAMAEAILEAAAAAGIGLTLLPVYYRTSGFAAAALPEQRRFVGDPDGFARLMESTRGAAARLPGTVVGIAPHSLRAAPLADIRAILPLAAGGPVHIHLAEQKKEVADCIAATGAPPLTCLFDAVDVDARWCLVHATHLTAPELARLAASGAVAGLCPVTEANLGDGIFPLPDLLRHGGRFGVGTDSNVSIGAAEELRMLEYSQRLRGEARNVAGGAGSTGRALFAGAVTGGAAALGREPAALAAGAPADIVSLDAHSPSLATKSGDALLDGWIFSAGSAAVDCVWAGGVKCVAGGRHRARERIAARYRDVITALLASF